MMCGRIEMLFDGMKQTLDDLFEVPLSIQTNLDLRPTDTVTCITRTCPETSPSINAANPSSTTIATISHSANIAPLTVINSHWGIKPTWSKKIIINAQGETAADKATFANAFKQQRCIIPCSAWFEWRDERQSKKQKYRFSHAANKPLFMAGILYPAENQLVTLTIKPNDTCAQYHQRMPLFIPSTEINNWLYHDVSQLQPLLNPLPDKWIKVSRA
ncbi:SOS response-associated peptidase [Shewanella sp. UCD-KL21]|uniref:SOS response-associated peptidase n=1 Tax=Shewanella sp. UCD-KL21 TaxID=1917164 RepID=UPI0009F87018|nr:SOS response-associated peptidase family protein [Shewanella sp. UCD-KL21]